MATFEKNKQKFTVQFIAQTFIFVLPSDDFSGKLILLQIMSVSLQLKIVRQLRNLNLFVKEQSLH